jgi:hypothetical protein
LGATERNSEQLRPPQSTESQPMRLDRSGWGPGGRRFNSCLPDRRKALLKAVFCRLMAAGHGVQSGVQFRRDSVRIRRRIWLDGVIRRLRRADNGRRHCIAPGPEPGGRRSRSVPTVEDSGAPDHRNFAVIAAHCADDGCGERVMFGLDTTGWAADRSCGPGQTAERRGRHVLAVNPALGAPRMIALCF